MLFTNVILKEPVAALLIDVRGETDGEETAYDINEYATQTQTTEEETTETKLTAAYKNIKLYSGQVPTADDFVVKLERADGSSEILEDYECEQLDGSPLEAGSNTFIFSFAGLSTIITVDAVDQSELMYPPSVVLYGFDQEEAALKAESIDKGELSYDEAFSNVCFTGDSQIAALTSYGILSTGKVVAQVGSSYEFMAQNMDAIVAMASGKGTIIVHYGINSLSESQVERDNLIAQYKGLLQELQTRLPDLRIIVSCVFPVSYRIFANQTRFAYITEYDFALMQMCTEIGVEYLSENEYISAHEEYFCSDGLHLEKNFYTEYWLKNLILTFGL